MNEFFFNKYSRERYYFLCRLKHAITSKEVNDYDVVLICITEKELRIKYKNNQLMSILISNIEEIGQKGIENQQLIKLLVKKVDKNGIHIDHDETYIIKFFPIDDQFKSTYKEFLDTIKESYEQSSYIQNSKKFYDLINSLRLTEEEYFSKLKNKMSIDLEKNIIDDSIKSLIFSILKSKKIINFFKFLDFQYFNETMKTIVTFFNKEYLKGFKLNQDLCLSSKLK